MRCAFACQNLIVDDAGSDDGTPGGGIGRTGLLQGHAFMGEQSADIVIGALQKVRSYICKNTNNALVSSQLTLLLVPYRSIRGLQKVRQ